MTPRNKKTHVNTTTIFLHSSPVFSFYISLPILLCVCECVHVRAYVHVCAYVHVYAYMRKECYQIVDPWTPSWL